MWNLRTKQNRKRFINTEHKLVVARGDMGGEMSKIDKED